jgi:hypothetical protein
MALKNIYTLDGPGGIDQVEGFVVVADNELEARELAASQPGDEGKDYWFRFDVAVLQVGTALPHIAGSDVILRSYNRG